MACERCGAPIASDMARFNASFRTPSGSPLHLDILMHGSTSAVVHKSAFFCSACWTYFLEMFGEVGKANRLTDVTTQVPGN